MFNLHRWAAAIGAYDTGITFGNFDTGSVHNIIYAIIKISREREIVLIDIFTGGIYKFCGRDFSARKEAVVVTT